MTSRLTIYVRQRQHRTHPVADTRFGSSKATDVPARVCEKVAPTRCRLAFCRIVASRTSNCRVPQGICIYRRAHNAAMTTSIGGSRLSSKSQVPTRRYFDATPSSLLLRVCSLGPTSQQVLKGNVSPPPRCKATKSAAFPAISPRPLPTKAMVRSTKRYKGGSEVPEENWHQARLIPTSGINGAEEQERRATSALLAVMSSVKEFGRGLTQPLGAIAGAVETYIEVPFILGDKRLYPDGLITVSRGPATGLPWLRSRRGTTPSSMSRSRTTWISQRSRAMTPCSRSPMRFLPSPANTRPRSTSARSGRWPSITCLGPKSCAKQ